MDVVTVQAWMFGPKVCTGNMDVITVRAWMFEPTVCTGKMDVFIGSDIKEALSAEDAQSDLVLVSKYCESHRRCHGLPCPAPPRIFEFVLAQSNFRFTVPGVQHC